MNSKLENQQNAAKSSNDPSSPTGGPKPLESKLDAEPPVRCSAWLGDYVRSELNKVMIESTQPGGAIYQYLNRVSSVSGNATRR
jgi:hypothetical protein